MMHQVMLLSELPQTFVTGKRLLIFMYQNMRLQLVGVGETREADIALVGTFASVNP